MPEATKMTVHIYAAMAQHEREEIGRRTKNTLAATKARGVALGNPCILRGERIPGSGNIYTKPSPKAEKHWISTYHLLERAKLPSDFR